VTALAHPQLLWLALPLLAVWAGMYFWRSRKDALALGFSDTSLFAKLPESFLPRLRRIVAWSRLATLMLLALALARPQHVKASSQHKGLGIDIVLAVDTSGSMRALDLDNERSIPERRTRLEVVKDVVKSFVSGRPEDQIGMVVFGAEAFMQCPLTLDHGLVESLVDKLEIGMAGDATAIGTGLGVAVKRLEKSKAKSKVVILLTDGVQNAGQLSPHQAALVAQALGIRVYTIGAGSRGKAPIIQNHPFFGQQIVYQEVSIDEAALKDIAETTGGAYFRAVDEAGLKDIYARIDKMEKTEIDDQRSFDYDERFAVFAWPALLLLLGEVALLGTRLLRVP
jgi:Ca-activated chloride channel homolog